MAINTPPAQHWRSFLTPRPWAGASARHCGRSWGRGGAVGTPGTSTPRSTQSGATDVVCREGGLGRLVGELRWSHSSRPSCRCPSLPASAAWQQRGLKAEARPLPRDLARLLTGTPQLPLGFQGRPESGCLYPCPWAPASQETRTVSSELAVAPSPQPEHHTPSPQERSSAGCFSHLLLGQEPAGHCPARGPALPRHCTLSVTLPSSRDSAQGRRRGQES